MVPEMVRGTRSLTDVFSAIVRSRADSSISNVSCHGLPPAAETVARPEMTLRARACMRPMFNVGTRHSVVRPA